MNPDDPLMQMLLAAVFSGGSRPDLGDVPTPEGPSFGAMQMPQGNDFTTAAQGFAGAYDDYRQRQEAERLEQLRRSGAGPGMPGMSGWQAPSIYPTPPGYGLSPPGPISPFGPGMQPGLTPPGLFGAL